MYTKEESLALVEQFQEKYPFLFDAYQSDAMTLYAMGSSVLVAAPTGTGKTIVAEFAVWLALRSNMRVFYTAPIKALSNQKFHDFRERYGVENVGLLTGDIVENASAPIVVMTTEIYRNVLLELERDDFADNATEFAGAVVSQSQLSDRKLTPDIANLACVIFDELHFMADPQRGPVWEESIIHSPDRVRFICLSATVRNANEIVGWLEKTHGNTRLISHPERSAPLEDYLYYKNKLTLVRDQNGKRVQKFPNIGGELKRMRSFNRREYYNEDPDNEVLNKFTAPMPIDVLGALRGAGLLPCLYFLPGRKAVEEAAFSCKGHSLVSAEEREHIQEEIEFWRQAMSDEDCQLQQVARLTHLLPSGIGYHHAGLIPALKQLIERLFVKGLLRAVFATDTLAMGVNMPARSVIVGSMSKFDGRVLRLMTPNEYQQLTGRAGRRGIDAYGAAVLLYSPWDEFEKSFTALTAPLQPVNSAFVLGYNSTLNLWRPNQLETIRKVCSKSFREYQRIQRVQNRKAAKKQNKHNRNTEDTSLDYTASDESADMVQLGVSVERELLATVGVLRTFSYIDQDTDALTVKGYLLRAIFHSSGLLLTELLVSGAFDTLTSSELAEVISWFVYDSDKMLVTSNTLSDRLKTARRVIKNMQKRVQHIENQFEISLSPSINETFSGVAQGWSQGFSLNGLQQRISLAEGDLLQILNQTIDLLQQLESALEQILLTPEHWSFDNSLTFLERRELRQRFDSLRVSLRLAIKQLMRGIVAQSRSLPLQFNPNVHTDDATGTVE